MKKKLSIQDKIDGIIEYSNKLELLEKKRNIPITFSLNEIHDIHMALREHVDDKNCPYHKEYTKLYYRIVKYCNCADSPKSLEKNIKLMEEKKNESHKKRNI